MDVASISYSVPKYYEEPNPTVTLHLNDFAPSRKAIGDAAIVPSVWDEEGIVYLSDPATISDSSSKPLIEVANYAISVEVWPPHFKVPVEKDEGVKVLYGSLTDCHGTRRPLGGAPFPTLAPLTSSQSRLTTDDVKGAVILRLKPISTPATSEHDWEDLQLSLGESKWSAAADVPVRTTFDARSAGLRMPDKKFVKVEDTWWGGGFKGVEFYNLTGFHFRFLDSKVNLAHMQFWVAGEFLFCPSLDFLFAQCCGTLVSFLSIYQVPMSTAAHTTIVAITSKRSTSASLLAQTLAACRRSNPNMKIFLWTRSTNYPRLPTNMPLCHLCTSMVVSGTGILMAMPSEAETMLSPTRGTSGRQAVAMVWMCGLR